MSVKTHRKVTEQVKLEIVKEHRAELLFTVQRFRPQLVPPYRPICCLVQGLLLFDTLIMVWSYTEAARGQVEVGLILRRESNKPIVVSTHDDEFCLQNIGPGVALNSFIVVPVGPHAPNIHETGALPAEGSAFYSIPIDHLRVNPGDPPSNHLVIAEALYTRTQQWIVTLNVLRGDSVVHRRAEFSLLSQRTTLREFLDSKYTQLRQQLMAFAAEVEQNT